MTTRLPARRAISCFLLVLVALGFGRPARAADDARVYVVLWFDTEDYLLPADDDATLHLARFLSDEKIRGTFKLVGEKARVLEERGRKDVLEALERHEIGYHSNFHSVQPTPALYMSRQGWLDGIQEFDRREHQGLLDVERITGQKPSCYGQPGSSWGPQQFGALDRWGVPVYLDAGSHVTLDGGPFWYGRVLNLYGLRATLRTKLGGSQDVAEAKKEFDAAYRRLLDEGGGPVSIYYHPCEFVHRQFWDGVNFAKGANPPRAEWRVPPQKSPEESRVAYEAFEEYVRFIKAHPRVRFVVASQGLELYRDRARERKFTRDELRRMAEAVTSGVDFQRREQYALAPSEIFALLNQFAVAAASGKEPTELMLAQTPFGPAQEAPEHGDVTSDISQFERTAADVADYLDRHGQVPNAVWLGSTPISPESYLVLLARYAVERMDGRMPHTVTAHTAELAAATHVSVDQPKLWGWVIFPPGFHAPEMMRLAKRQAWTLKPAVLNSVEP